MAVGPVPPNVTLADLSTQGPLPDSMVDPAGSEFVYTPQSGLVVPWVAPVAPPAQARRIHGVNVTHKTAVALAAARATLAALGEADAAADAADAADAAAATAATSAGSMVVHSSELRRSPVGDTGGEVAVTAAPVTLHKPVRALCYLRYVNPSTSVEDTISEFQVYLAAALAITLCLNARRVSRATRRSPPDGQSRVPGALPWMNQTLFAHTTTYDASVSRQASPLTPLSASDMQKVVAGANRMLDDVQRHAGVSHSDPEASEDQKWHDVANQIVWCTRPSAAAAPTAEAGEEPDWLVDTQRQLRATTPPARDTRLGAHTPPWAPGVRVPIPGMPVDGTQLATEGGARPATGDEAQNAQIEALQARVQAFQRALGEAAVEIAEQKKKALRVEAYIKGHAKGGGWPGSVDSSLSDAKLTRIRNEQTFQPAAARAESLKHAMRSPRRHSPGDLSV